MSGLSGGFSSIWMQLHFDIMSHERRYYVPLSCALKEAMTTLSLVLVLQVPRLHIDWLKMLEPVLLG